MTQLILCGFLQQWKVFLLQSQKEITFLEGEINDFKIFVLFLLHFLGFAEKTPENQAFPVFLPYFHAKLMRCSVTGGL
jgi:hypothetical protein